MEKHALPSETEAWLREACVTLRHMSAAKVRDLALRQLAQWRDRPFDRKVAIPGYTTPPPDLRGTGHPHGWSLSQFARIRREAGRIARIVRTAARA